MEGASWNPMLHIKNIIYTKLQAINRTRLFNHASVASLNTKLKLYNGEQIRNIEPKFRGDS